MYFGKIKAGVLPKRQDILNTCRSIQYILSMKLAVIGGLLLTSVSGGVANAADMYANVEANTGVAEAQVGPVVTEVHLGVEDTIENGASWFVQAGPMITANDGSGKGSLDLSGKLGGSVPVNTSIDLYGELSFATGDFDTAYGAKLGTKFKF